MLNELVKLWVDFIFYIFLGKKAVRPVPNSSAALDQNFNREEKLAIYDYVIAHTKQQQTFTDLHLQ